jgi:hypothetical protein
MVLKKSVHRGHLHRKTAGRQLELRARLVKFPQLQLICRAKQIHFTAVVRRSGPIEMAINVYKDRGTVINRLGSFVLIKRSDKVFSGCDIACQAQSGITEPRSVRVDFRRRDSDFRTTYWSTENI